MKKEHRGQSAENRSVVKPVFERTVCLILTLILAFDLAGCAQIQRKFTRKKKETARLPAYKAVKVYETKPSPELYEKHFSYWQSWQKEYMQVMGKNSKKDARCINEMISNLRDMQNILIDEKASELEPHIARIEGLKDMIISGDGAAYNSAYVRSVLETEQLNIYNNFRYKKVKDYLKESFEDDL